jgi:hypothetical protein
MCAAPCDGMSRRGRVQPGSTNMTERRRRPFCVRIAIATLLLAMAGCAELSNTVIMDYDQVNNFRRYAFEKNLPWEDGTPQPGIYGYGYNGQNNGFWATFVICNVRNENSKAETFHYDVHDFFVVHGDKEHPYKPMDPYTYSSIPMGLAATPVVNGLVNAQFRVETQLGNDTNTFNKGFNEAVNYRFAIYVTVVPGPLDTSVPLKLRYKGHPNLLNSRGHDPVVKSGSEPTTRAELRTTCRPKAQ